MSSDVIQQVDLAVLGGGTIGLSAAYYGAAAGLKTVLFEQYDFGNDKASSDGDSRMFRVMYSEEDMAQLAEASLGQWQEIEHYTGDRLLDRKGLLFYGLPASSVEGNLNQCAEVMSQMGIPYTRYSAEQLPKAYDVFKEIPKDYFGLSQPSGATILVKHSLHTFARLAREHGAHLYTHCKATIRPAKPGKGPYLIETEKGLFEAKHLVLAPGAWSNPVLSSFGLQLNLTIWQMTVAYYKVDPHLKWPMWYEFGPTKNNQQQLFYGFPLLDGSHKIKVSADFTNNQYQDPSQCTYQPDPRILDQMSSFMMHRFKGVEPTPHDAICCLYTMSPDAQVVLDTLPGFENVAVLTGESGRAFKYTPVFGRILVQLATTGKSTYNISEFSIKRKGIIR